MSLKGRSILHSISGRNLKEGRGGLGLANIRQAVDGFTHARICPFTHNHSLELVRIPALGHNLNGLFVPNAARRNGDRLSGSIGLDALNHLRSQGFGLHGRSLRRPVARNPTAATRAFRGGRRHSKSSLTLSGRQRGSRRRVALAKHFPASTAHGGQLLSGALIGIQDVIDARHGVADPDNLPRLICGHRPRTEATESLLAASPSFSITVKISGGRVVDLVSVAQCLIHFRYRDR